MLSFRTQGYSGYATRYSPFFDSKLAVAGAANYGLVGNGRIYILDIGPDGTLQPQNVFDTQDGAFSLAWSETHENHLVSAHGDGAVKLFDITQRQFPLMSWHEHAKEVFAVSWNLVDKHVFCSASWDESIKLWDPTRPNSLQTFRAPHLSGAPPPQARVAVPMTKTGTGVGTPTGGMGGGAGAGGSNCIYAAKFSPHEGSILASAHSDSTIRVWDVRTPEGRPATVIPHAHSGLECLALDWNKYRASTLASGGVDKAVKIWDLRRPRGTAPLNDLRGHDYAVRSVSWSPHAAEVLISGSYDTTARVWRDTSVDSAPYNPRVNHTKGQVSMFDRHTEFVIDADWSLWGQPGWVASTGWDEMVYLWKAV